MGPNDRTKLKDWVESRYHEDTDVPNARVSVTIDRNLFTNDSVGIYTDGVTETNHKDGGLETAIISCYNYVIICRHGAIFRTSSEPRIIVYCNPSSDWSFGKFKSTIKHVLENYT